MDVTHGRINPTEEKEMDEISDKWEWRIITLGYNQDVLKDKWEWRIITLVYNEDVLKYALLRLASETALRIFRRRDLVENWQDLRNALKMDLFLKST